MLIAERFKFQQQNHQPSESISDYIAQLHKLTEHCRFEGPQLEDALRDRFVAGICSSSIQRKLLSQVELTLKDAIKIAQGMESTQKQSETLRQATGLSSSMAAAPVQAVAVKRKFTKPQKPCYRCGGAGHTPDRCYHCEKVCNTCHRRGHLATVCRSSANAKGDGVFWKAPSRASAAIGKAKAHHVEVSDSEEYEIYTLKPLGEARWLVTPLIDGTQMEMAIDTGSAVSITFKKVWISLLKSRPLKATSAVLKTVTGEKVPVLGELEVSVQHNGQDLVLPLLVMDGNGPLMAEIGYQGSN